MLQRTTRNFSPRWYSQAVGLKEKYCNDLGTNVQNSKPEGWEDAKPYKSIPGPKPIPIFGNTWRYLIGPLSTRDYLLQQKRMHEAYGDILAVTKIHSTLADMITLFSPIDIEKMFRNEGPRPMREGFHSLREYRNVIRKDIFGDVESLLGSRGEKWYHIRSKVNPILLQPRTVQQYTNCLSEVASDFIERMKMFAKKDQNSEMPEDFQTELNRWSFESVGVVALDRRLGCLDENPNADSLKMINNMVELFKITNILDFTPLGAFYRKYNFPMWKQFVKYQDFFTNMTLGFMDEAAENIKRDANYDSKPEHEKSAFEKLLIKDKQVAMVMTLDMLAAGIDTTGKMLASILYFLAKNQDAQNKLREETIKLLPTLNSSITKETVEQMQYVKAVIKEGQRMAPVTVGNMRVTTKEMVLGGYQIPIGMNIVVPNLYLSLSDQHYPRPKEFLPERWLKKTTGDISYKNTHPFVTLPFGFGPRFCIGKRIASLELEIIISKIVRNFYLEWPHPDQKFGLGQTLLYGCQDPVKIRVKQITE